MQMLHSKETSSVYVSICSIIESVWNAQNPLLNARALRNRVRTSGSPINTAHIRYQEPTLKYTYTLVFKLFFIKQKIISVAGLLRFYSMPLQYSTYTVGWKHNVVMWLSNEIQAPFMEMWFLWILISAEAPSKTVHTVALSMYFSVYVPRTPDANNVWMRERYCSICNVQLCLRDAILP